MISPGARVRHFLEFAEIPYLCELTGNFIDKKNRPQRRPLATGSVKR